MFTVQHLPENQFKEFMVNHFEFMNIYTRQKRSDRNKNE